MHFSPYPTYFLICMKLNFSVFLLPMATTHSFFCLCYSFFLFWDSFPRILLFPFSSLTISSHLFQLKDFFVQDSLYPLPSSKLLTTYGRLSANNHLNILLKGKLRHTNIFFLKFIWANIASDWAVLNWKWLEALHRWELGTRFYTEAVEAKQRNYLIGNSLSSCLFWESLVSYLWLVVC